jgi:hypothetical protein
VEDTLPPSITCPVPTVAECTGNASAPVDPGAANATDACQLVSVSPPAVQSYPLGTTDVAYTAIDIVGHSASCLTQVTVQDTTPPSITCPAPIVAECTGSSSAPVTPGAASASDICTTATVAGPAAGSYPVGTTEVTYTATDQSGNQASCSSTIQVVDTTPPVVTVTAPNPLWPPNHKNQVVSLSDCGVVVQDQCSGAIDLNSAAATITCVSSDEPLNTTGDGNTVSDIVFIDGTTVSLGSERRGSGDGRVYKIHFQVSDANGNVTTGICPVSAPHDQGRAPAVDSGTAVTVCR